MIRTNFQKILTQSITMRTTQWEKMPATPWEMSNLQNSFNISRMMTMDYFYNSIFWSPRFSRSLAVLLWATSFWSLKVPMRKS